MRVVLSMLYAAEDVVPLVECLPRIQEAPDCIQLGYMRLCLKTKEV